MNKLWYTSKTLWLNVLAIIGIVFFGKELPPEVIVALLGGLNFVLRLITKKPIVWTNGK